MRRKVSDRKHWDAWRVWKLHLLRLRKAAAKAASHKRRALKAGAAGHHTPAQAMALLHDQGGGCAYCGSRDKLHLDHMTPLARGGSNWPINLQWLCAFHNLSKSDRTDSEYREAHGLEPARPNRYQLAARLEAWVTLAH